MAREYQKKFATREQEIKEKGKTVKEELVKKFDFLWPRSPFTLRKDPTYDYSYSVLDSLPDGWVISFIPDFCKELNEIFNNLKMEEKDPYIFTRINSVYGHFTVHSNWTTSEIDNLIKKYENISLCTCEECGKKAFYRGNMNGIPYCRECSEKYKRYNTFTPVDDFKEFGQEGYK